MGLPTPTGARYLDGTEERLVRYFAPRLFKIISSQYTSEKSGVYYDGPIIQGVGLFHDLPPQGQIVALYLTMCESLDRYITHPLTLWKNGVMDCLYSWMIYDIGQELVSGTVTGRTHVTKAYQQRVNQDARGDSSNSSLTRWTEMVHKLAERVVYLPEHVRLIAHDAKGWDQQLIFDTELFNKASKYFDDGMPTDLIVPELGKVNYYGFESLG